MVAWALLNFLRETNCLICRKDSGRKGALNYTVFAQSNAYTSLW